MSRWKKGIKEWIQTLVVAGIIAIILRTFVIAAYKIPTGSMEPTLHGDPRNGDRIFANKFIYRFKDPERGDVIIFTTKGIPGLRKKDFIKRLVGLPGDRIRIEDGVVYVNGEPFKNPALKDNYYYNSDPVLVTISPVKKRFRVPDFFFTVVDDLGNLYLLSNVIYELSSGIKRGDRFLFDPEGILGFPESNPFDVTLVGRSGDIIELKKDGLYVNRRLFKKGYTIKNMFTVYGQYGMRGMEIEVPEGGYFVLGDNSANSKDSRYWGFVPRRNIKGEGLVVWWPPYRWKVIR